MKQYLTFSSESHTFGLESAHVLEIFPLPELQSIAEAPGDIIGLLNIRGRLTPIMHLAKRLGITQPTCQIKDSVVLIAWQGLHIGIIVNQVLDVLDISAEQISKTPDLDRDQYVHTALIHGFAQMEETLVSLLHPESLIRQADEVAVLAWEADLSQEEEGITPSTEDALRSSNNFYSFCSSVTRIEKKMFKRRATELREPIESYDISSLQPITLLSIEGELFGVDLKHVREFIHLPNLTSIPCSPQYIIGNFNLRGEIMTLLDLSSAMELPHSADRPKAVILEVDRQRIGVSVDEVHDVIYLAHEDYLEFPSTISKEHQQFLSGAFDHQGQVVRLLDLAALLNNFRPKVSLVA